MNCEMWTGLVGFKDSKGQAHWSDVGEFIATASTAPGVAMARAVTIGLPTSLVDVWPVRGATRRQAKKMKRVTKAKTPTASQAMGALVECSTCGTKQRTKAATCYDCGAAL